MARTPFEHEKITAAVSRPHGRRVRRVRDTSPEVDDAPAVDVGGASRTDVTTIGEVRDERVHHGPEAPVDEAMDPSAVRQLDRRAGGARRRRHGHHPLTDPWSRAAMTWRWNTMNTSRVGTRIRIVPALKRGMSVA